MRVDRSLARTSCPSDGVDLSMGGASQRPRGAPHAFRFLLYKRGDLREISDFRLIRSLRRPTCHTPSRTVAPSIVA